jgi:predicted glutamine amidotransferase
LPDEYEDIVLDYENGKIDDEDFEDKMILLAKSTKRMFAEDKKALDEEREQFHNRQKNEFQVMKKSALLSVENLSKAYPSFSKSEISKIRNILVEGKVDNLFVNADGSYNDDAAELVAYAMYGKKMLESVKKIAERKGESKVNQKLVDSSPKSIKKNKSAGGSQQGVSMDMIGHLSGVFKGDPYA